MKTKKYRIIFRSFTRSEKLKEVLEELNIKYEHDMMAFSYTYNFETTKDNFKKIRKALAIDKTNCTISYIE